MEIYQISGERDITMKLFLLTYVHYLVSRCGLVVIAPASQAGRLRFESGQRNIKGRTDSMDSVDFIPSPCLPGTEHTR